MVYQNFWNGKKVLLTGHTGFKGSWVSLWLQKLGAELTGYALSPPTNPSLFNEAQLANGMNSIIADIRNYEKLYEVIKQTKPEIIIHMAAQPLVRYSYDFPRETYETNVMGTVNLLDAIRKSDSVRVLVNVTTDKCYKNNEWLWAYRENETLGGHDSYSSSKACSELVTQSFRDSFFSNSDTMIASARAGNVIGGGDWSQDRLIPDIIKSIQSRNKIQLRNPQSIRPWQHVLEPLSGYLTLAEKLYTEGASYAQAWNFGPDESDVQNVEWIVKTFSDLWPEKIDYEVVQTEKQPHEANYLKLDCSKAKNLLMWSPKWNLQMALSKIVSWNIAYNENQNVQKTTLNQIYEYENFNLSNAK